MKCNQIIERTLLAGLLAVPVVSQAALLTDPNDPRSWQGANVGTFATLYYGSNTAANRQLVIDNQLLDDSIFNAAGYSTGTLLNTAWAQGLSGDAHAGGNCRGYSTDTTGTGGYGYLCAATDVYSTLANAANGIDNFWFQSSAIIGDTVFDLGFQATKAAVFNTIDHGPMPQEAIESTIYLSNDQVTWTEAVVERVWLEGFNPILGIQWDGFTYAVGTGTSNTFRYASVIWGGPGALISDGDNEINGIMGLRGDFTPNVPVPAAAWLFGSGLLGLAGVARRRRS